MAQIKAKNKKRGFFSVFLHLKSYLNIIFLLLLFPLGIISFCITLLLLVFSLTLGAMPFFAPFGPMTLAGYAITYMPIKIIVSLIACVLGIFLLTVGLYIINGLSFIYKKLFRLFG